MTITKAKQLDKHAINFGINAGEFRWPNSKPGDYLLRIIKFAE